MPATRQQEDIDYLEKLSLTDLVPLLNDIARQLSGSGIDAPSRFCFIWQNIHFAGQVLSAGDDNCCSLNLVASPGYIPFSAEDAPRRRKLLDIFTPLFARGDYSLSVNSQIQMTILTSFAGPVNARRLVEVITFTLLDLQVEMDSLQNAMTGREMV